MSISISRRLGGALAAVAALSGTVVICSGGATTVNATLSDGVSGEFLLDNGIIRLGKLSSTGCGPDDAGCSHPDAGATRFSESVDPDGRMAVPMLGYSDGGQLNWAALTYNQRALDIAIGIGYDGPLWNGNSTLEATQTNGVIPFPWDSGRGGSKTSAVSFDPVTERAVGSITHSGARITMEGITLEVSQKYEVLSGQPFVRATMTVRNLSNVPAPNVSVWAGTTDDRFGTDDSLTKIRGNLTTAGFVPLTDPNAPSNVVQISSDVLDLNAVFYSTTPGARSVYSAFAYVGGGSGRPNTTTIIPNFTREDPATSGSLASACDEENDAKVPPGMLYIQCDNNDGSYGVFMPVGDLARGQVKTVVYYYGVGIGSDLDSVMRDLYVDANSTVRPRPPVIGLPDPVPTVERVGGADRFGTAAAISSRFFSSSAVVYVVLDGAEADAVPAAAAAGARGAPVLLVRGDSVPGLVMAEIARLDPSRIVIVGGSARVGDAVAAELGAAFGVGKLDRVGGSNRVATAVAVSEDTWSDGSDLVYVVGSDAPADAVVAAAHGRPVLFSHRDVVPAATVAEIARLGATRVVVVGGTARVSAAAFSELSAALPGVMVERIAGPDRYGTSRLLAEMQISSGGDTVFVTSGLVAADSFGAAAAAHKVGAALVLTLPDCLPAATASLITGKNLVIVGGSSAITDAVGDRVTCGA